jgi:cell division protease FtsH
VKKKLRTALIWIVMVGVFIIAFNLSYFRQPERYEDFENFLHHVEEGRVSEVHIDNTQLSVCLHTNECYNTQGVIDNELMGRLSGQGVHLQWGKKSFSWTKIIIIAAIVFSLIFLFLYVLKKSNGGAANFMALRKSTARRITDSGGITFQKIGGCTEAKELLSDVIDFLKNTERWYDAGVRLPRGILLEGPPGSGKTLLARAVAGETKAHFFLLSASEFVEMFVGVGAARVRDLFETAVKEAPAIIFIDELDAVGRRRGSGVGAAHDEREQTLNQLLVCMDGFQNSDSVVVIGATNRADILDKALLRPGRFDRRIKIPKLSRENRLEVLKIHTQNKSLDPDVSLEKIAAQTGGLNGADLENIVNEAAMLTLRRARIQKNNSSTVVMADFTTAMAAFLSRTSQFNKLDSVLVESASQLAEPSGKAFTRLTLKQDAVVEGQVVWADASFIKLRHNGNGIETIVPKYQILKIDTLEGTEYVGPDDMAVDPWAARNPELA